MKDIKEYINESIGLKFTYYDSDNPKKNHQEITRFTSKPNKNDLSEKIINVLTNEISWFDEKWLNKNKDVLEEINKLCDQLIKDGNSDFIYTYKFYLE